MTLKEKLDNAIWDCSSREVVEEVEKIADDFAIGFADWLDINTHLLCKSTKELLEIYKKEKGL